MLPLKIERTEIAEFRMSPRWIVKAFNEIEDVRPRVVARAIMVAMDTLGFECGEEAFGHGVIPHITGATHTARHADFAQQSLKRLTRVLRSSVRVKHQGRRASASPHRHHERVRDELRGHLRLHRPADDASRKEIEHDRDKEPAFARPHVREIGDPFLIGRGRVELLVQHIRRERVYDVRARVLGTLATFGACAQARVSHEPCNALSPAREPRIAHVGPHATHAIRAITRHKTLAHDDEQRVVHLRAHRRWSFAPRVESTARHAESVA